jgi:hypothetical protein
LSFCRRPERTGADKSFFSKFRKYALNLVVDHNMSLVASRVLLSRIVSFFSETLSDIESKVVERVI